MEAAAYLSSLPRQEREALQLCGISRDDQLARADARQLACDLEKARELFPDKVTAVPLERLQHICAAAPCGEEGLPVPAVGASVQQPEPGAGGKVTGEGDVFQPRQCPKLEIRRGRHETARRPGPHRAASPETEEGGRAATASDREHAIHCVRPFRIYFGALATLLLAVDLAACVVVPLYLLTGMQTGVNLNDLALIALAAALPYLLWGLFAHCPVCNIRLFSFLHRFPRNRNAHRLPFLGYSVATALHIVFCFWFHCPACGTAQRLWHRSHSRHSH